jgi:hypothetical protein
MMVLLWAGELGQRLERNLAPMLVLEWAEHCSELVSEKLWEMGSELWLVQGMVQGLGQLCLALELVLN